MPDTSSLSKTLQEIVVKAPESNHIGNRSLYYPSKKLRETMSTTSQLLAGLQIPDLIVNPATGDISASGSGKLIIKINGRTATQTELMTISAKEITKVEYITNPGVRYGDAVGVLEFTVKRKDDGYGVVLNLLQSVNRGWGDYTASLKYNTGRSEWSADYHSNPMWNMDCYRDNKERIKLHDGNEIIRQEAGIKVPNRMATHRATLQYSYAQKSSILFNVQARLVRQNDKYVSLGSITTAYKSSISKELEKEVAPFSLWQSDLDFYLHWKINPRHKVYFNIIPSFIKSTSYRIYETEELSISSGIDNKGYIFLSEGVWEGKIGRGIMIGGIREEIQYNKSIYSTNGSMIREKTTESHCFFEWNHNIKNFKYIIGIDCSLFRVTKLVANSFTNLTPKLFISYSPLNWLGINLAIDGSSVNPTPSQLIPIEQRVDQFQYSEGSTSLSPFRQYKFELGTDFKIKDATMKFSITDKYSHKPIMGFKMFDKNKIKQTYCNAGYHNDIIIKAQLRIPLIIKDLNLSFEGGWHQMVSKGNDYFHHYSQGFINAQLMYIKGSWWFMAKYNNAYNILWGEMISTVNNNLLNLGVGYRYKSAVFMAGIVNPIGNVSIKSRDLSSIAGYERTYHAASTKCLAWIGITFNQYKGKRRVATQKKLDNIKIFETIKNVQK